MNLEAFFSIFKLNTMKEQAKKTLDIAVNKLKEANEELFRPEEDVISYSVCKNSQFAIENYLKGYLQQRNVDTTSFTTIEILFDECVKVNPEFKKIDLSDFQCKSHKIDSTYCNDVKKVSNCFDVADSLDTFLRQEKVI